MNTTDTERMQIDDELYGIDDAIITGEGVALELPAATVLSRIVSGGIDYTLYALMLVGFWAWVNSIYDGKLSTADPNIIGILQILSCALLWWIIPSLVTAMSHGSSLGKLIARTRVVRHDGGTVTYRQAFVRHLIGIVEVWVSLGVIAMSVAFFSQRGLRLGDILAGTYVVRWPKGSLTDFEIHMPEQLTSWASTVQTRALSPELSLMITDHLRRRKTLDPTIRQERAASLAAEAEQFVSPPPPWGTPAEDFLSALTIVRNHRSIERGRRQQDRYAQTLASISTLPYDLAQS